MSNSKTEEIKKPKFGMFRLFLAVLITNEIFQLYTESDLYSKLKSYLDNSKESLNSAKKETLSEKKTPRPASGGLLNMFNKETIEPEKDI